MKRFTTLLLDFKGNLSQLNREAALDSLRNILMVLGLATLLADFATMKVVYVLPCMFVALAVWYIDYLRHDFTPAQPEQKTLFEQVCDKAKV